MSLLNSIFEEDIETLEEAEDILDDYAGNSEALIIAAMESRTQEEDDNVHLFSEAESRQDFYEDIPVDDLLDDEEDELLDDILGESGSIARSMIKNRREN